MDPEAPVASTAATGTYPVRVELDAPLTIARWRPFAHMFMGIPHFIVAYALQALAMACTVIAFFAILFTKKYPEGLFKFATMSYRYNWRITTFVLFMRESYPQFEYPSEPEDPGTDPARYSIEYPQELNRWLPLVKFILAIPLFLFFMVLAIGAVFVILGSFFAVLFTGKYPEGMRKYMVGVMRYLYRIQAYVYLMTDTYPPFSLD